MNLFRRHLRNEADQRFVARLYFALILAMLFRPDAGILLPYLDELTGVDPHNIAMVFIAFGFYLRRAQPMYLVEYLICLVPVALFSGYIAIFMFTTLSSSIVTSVFILFLWFKIIADLIKSVEALE